MKKIFMLSALVSILFAGCDSFEENDNTIISNEKQLQAGFADNTRTYVEKDKYLRWHENDRLTVFYGNTLNDQYRFKGKTGDNSGTFALVPSGELGTGNTLSNIYAIYPYNADAKISDDGIITYSFPATQNYAENSFAKDANTMVAVTNGISDTYLSFRNVCGYLKLKLYGNATIKSIEVKGNFSEKIAGDATITATYGETPTLKMNANATQTITLDCGEGVPLGTSADDATIFWIVIPETTFKYGITITATSTDNRVFTKSTSNSVVIERNTPLPMSALEFVGETTEIDPIVPSTIIYTTDDSNIVDLYTTDGFGSEYVSNVYDKENNIGTITFDGEITTIPAEAFLVCTNLTSVQIPNSVTTIAEKAFYGCNYMEKIIIPESVTHIAETAFEGCSGEAIINCKIGDNAFEGASFSKVIINNTIVGKEAFMNCVYLKHISLPNTITTIPYCTFQNCAIENMVIPESVLSIEEGAFSGCAKLKNIVIPESVEVLGPYVFCDCPALQEIKMPTTMTSVGEGAFGNCTSLIECRIPDGVKSLEDKTFHNCRNLTTLHLPATITSLSGAFYGCDRLSQLHLADINTWLKLTPINPEGFLGGEVPFAASGQGDIYGNIIGNPSCTKLVNIIIPESVTSIGKSAFSGCFALQNIDMHDGITNIGDLAFHNCMSLAEITIPKGTTEIKESVFDGCKSLKKVNMHNDITSIGRHAFKDCHALETLTLPKNLTTIGDEAFWYCHSLKYIDIPEGVKNIGYQVFLDSGLEEVVLPETLESIGYRAFVCAIKSIIIPTSVTSIDAAFFGATKLETVYFCSAKPPYMAGNIFDYAGGGTNDGYTTIYVPNEAIDVYKAALPQYVDQIQGYTPTL